MYVWLCIAWVKKQINKIKIEFCIVIVIVGCVDIIMLFMWFGNAVFLVLFSEGVEEREREREGY